MIQKTRLIIIGLVVMLAVSSFLIISFGREGQKLNLEKNTLKSENQALNKKIQESIQEKKQLQDKIDALNSDLDKASLGKQDIQKQYEAIVRERDVLADKIKPLQKSNDQLRGDLNNMARERQRLGQNMETNLAPLKNENTQLKEQLNNLNTLKVKLETELASLKKEKTELEQKFDEIDAVLRQNLTRLRYMVVREQLDAIHSPGESTPQTQGTQPEKESVELPPIVVLPQSKSEPQLPGMVNRNTSVRPTGIVLQVNKENKFIIIDLGEESGIKLGDIFNVYKQGLSIAGVEVIQVRQSISACDIKEETSPIEAGDIVR